MSHAASEPYFFVLSRGSAMYPRTVKPVQPHIISSTDTAVLLTWSFTALWSRYRSYNFWQENPFVPDLVGCLIAETAVRRTDTVAKSLWHCNSQRHAVRSCATWCTRTCVQKVSRFLWRSRKKPNLLHWRRPYAAHHCWLIMAALRSNGQAIMFYSCDLFIYLFCALWSSRQLNATEQDPLRDVEIGVIL